VPVDPEELEAALTRDLASYTETKERRAAADRKGNVHEES
jgi:hypothetical protein